MPTIKDVESAAIGGVLTISAIVSVVKWVGTDMIDAWFDCKEKLVSRKMELTVKLTETKGEIDAD